MSKTSRQKSTNPNYEVGYGRPPVAAQFAPKTSGNPRGRPPKAKAKGQQKPDPASGLSAIHRAVLDVGAAKVEVRRSGRSVKMTQVEAAVEGLAEAARNGNVRAAQVYIGMYSEADAEEKALRQSGVDVEHRELALTIAASLRAAKRDGPSRAELEPPTTGIESVGAEVEDQLRPSEAPQAPSDWSDGQRDAPPDSACLARHCSTLCPRRLWTHLPAPRRKVSRRLRRRFSQLCVTCPRRRRRPAAWVTHSSPIAGQLRRAGGVSAVSGARAS